MTFRISRVAPLLSLALVISATAAETVHVTKLRLSRVVMYDAPNGTAIGDVEKEQYVAGSWTVAGEPQAGFIKVNGNGKTFWVKNLAIDTDKKVTTSSECGVKIGGNVEKIGATRALGEGCK